LFKQSSFGKLMLAHQTTESAPISSNNKDSFTTHQESKTREIFDV